MVHSHMTGHILCWARELFLVQRRGRLSHSHQQLPDSLAWEPSIKWGLPEFTAFCPCPFPTCLCPLCQGLQRRWHRSCLCGLHANLRTPPHWGKPHLERSGQLPPFCAAKAAHRERCWGQNIGQCLWLQIRFLLMRALGFLSPLSVWFEAHSYFCRMWV